MARERGRDGRDAEVDFPDGRGQFGEARAEKNDRLLNKGTHFHVPLPYFCRKYAKERLNVPDKDLDYFEWETHIFFDDAFEPDDSGKESVVNQFVRDLVAKVDEQVSNCGAVPFAGVRTK